MGEERIMAFREAEWTCSMAMPVRELVMVRTRVWMVGSLAPAQLALSTVLRWTSERRSAVIFCQVQRGIMAQLMYVHTPYIISFVQTTSYQQTSLTMRLQVTHVIPVHRNTETTSAHCFSHCGDQSIVQFQKAAVAIREGGSTTTRRRREARCWTPRNCILSDM